MATESKFKKKRLFRVSRELNVSVDTLVDDLKTAGFKNALTGTGLNAAIVDPEAYEHLLDTYAEDKAAADRVKSKRLARLEESGEDHTDEVVSIEDAVEAEPGKEEPAPVPVEEPETEVPEPVAEPASETAEAEEAPAEAVEETPIEAIEEVSEPDAAEEVEETVEQEPEAPAPAEPAEVEAKSIPKAKAPARKKTTAKADAAPEPVDEEEAEEEVEGEDTLSAGRYRLQGTTVLGKIELPAEELEREGGRRRRKRKRKKTATTDGPKVSVKADDVDRRPGKKKKGRKKGAAVDEAEVEQTLQETLRELEQGASRVRQRRRRQRREQHAADRERELAEMEEQSGKLRVTEYLSTGELANLMDVSVTEVINTLLEAGMMVSINQRLDADTITFVADEFGYELEFITEFGTDDIHVEEDAPEDLQGRAPVVTVMGHVDHGKTSLLDYVRSANVVAGEAGGITQHIGAYHVELSNGKALTFLDTPGHEAFTAMRARGAKVTDLVILVVAADDSVKPQTVEAINHARAAEVPMVVAVNKIDKPDSNTQKVMQELADQNVLVEPYGGKVQCSFVSAKTGEGLEDLMDKVILEAELLELQANPDRNAVGTVIEARKDKGRGVVATVLVQTGTLKVGDTFVAGVHSGKVRAMFDERENRIDDVGPSKPALVLGFDGSPEVGDQFIVLDDERETRDIAQRRQQIHREQSLRQRKHITLDEIGRRLALGDFQELNLIVKADVGGSVEALSDSLLKLTTEEVAVNIIHTGVGAITESDVMLASASDAVIIGFQVRPMATARALAEREEIDVRTYSIIYDAIQDVRDALEGLLSPEKSEKTLGLAEVREIFKVPKVGTVAGCYVVDGKIRRSDRVRLIRDGVVIYEGNLASLKRFKDDVRDVQSGYECGMSMENYDDVKVGDQFEAFEIVETKRTLEV
ncbi:MAG: translation initiation factor IF-2 [Rhodothermia bacterium]|nr:translation initiation factor IF-2 [Rhodothermia bacterium]